MNVFLFEWEPIVFLTLFDGLNIINVIINIIDEINFLKKLNYFTSCIYILN